MVASIAMGVFQIAVVIAALRARGNAVGWYTLAALGLTLGTLPLFLIVTPIALGFTAPLVAYPLLIVADALLVLFALTFMDVGDNGPLVPLLTEREAAGERGRRLGRIGFRAGIAYVAVLVALIVWTVGTR
ncbi:hypothetical protein [Nocardia asteroides]|uniref:hypothetical protein n=1 Tax=Nocardia asteroides TaxID=1824 RepID=UPI001E4CCE31|nr:hypothetical protein [Nocardia asteroides]UGT62307.1 hypothetical protein LTT61_02875 [Nocardia asteroides]